MADEKQLVVNLALKSGTMKQQINTINKEIKQLQTDFKNAGAGVEDFEKTSEGLSAKLKLQQSVVEKLKDKLSVYKQEQEKCTSTLDKAVSAYQKQEQKIKSLEKALEEAKATYGENSEEVKKLEEELSKATKALDTKRNSVINANNALTNMNTTISSTEAEIKQLNKSLNGANWSNFGANAEALGNSVSNTGDKITGVGQKMSIASAGIVGAMTGAVKVSIDFEEAMSKVQSTSGATSEEIEILSKHAEQLGKDIKGASATEIAKSYDYLALAGYKTNEMLSAMEPVVKANIAFGGDMATTADLMTDSLSALGKGADDAQHYLDVVAQTSRNANTSGIQLMEAYIEVGGTLNNLNIPLEESAKVLAAMADNGLKGSEAGRSLQSVLINLMGTTSTTAGALETLGVQTYDAEGKFRGLTTVLGDVLESASKMTDEQSDMTLALLGGKTQLTALNNMLKSTDESYNGLAESINNSDGALEEMYLTMSDNTAGTFADLSSKIESVAKKFGDILLPVINNVVDGVIKFMDFLAGLSTEMQTTILIVGGVVAAIGPLLVVIGSMISNLGVIISAVGSLSSAIGTAGGLMGFFSASMLPVIATIGGVIAIVITLAMSIKENWEGIKEATNNLIETCRPYFEQLKESFKTLWETCKSIYDTVIQPLFKIIGEVIQECINFVAPILSFLMTTFSNVFNTISITWNTIGKPVFSFIMSIVQNVWDVFQPIFNSISSLFTNVVSAISSAWNNIGLPIFNGIMSVVSKVAEVVIPAFNTFKNVIIDAMNAVLSPIQWVIDKLSSLFGWLSNVGSKVSGVLEKINPFKNLFKSVDMGVNAILDASGISTFKLDNIALSGSYYNANSRASLNANDMIRQVNGMVSGVSSMGQTLALDCITKQFTRELNSLKAEDNNSINTLAKALETMSKAINGLSVDLKEQIVLENNLKVDAYLDKKSVLKEIVPDLGKVQNRYNKLVMR